MKKAIITGASKGLGKAFAEQLSSQGYDLLLVARSESLLKELSQTLFTATKQKVYYLALDLTVQDSPAKISAWCLSNAFTPDVLINNAGFACWGYFDQLNLQRQQEMLQVNVGTMVSLVHYTLPLLKQHKQSYILNVCSTAAYQAVPTMSVYAATKSFVRTFSRGLRRELKNTPVSVTCVSPGPIASNFLNEADMNAIKDTAAKFEMDPTDVARLALKAMFAKKNEAVPGFSNAFGVIMTKIVPDFILEQIAEGIYRSKLSKK